MLNKRKITNMYMIEGICNKCGGKLVSTDTVLTTYPPKYPYKCENPNCNGYEVFEEDNRPGKIIYEFEKAKPISVMDRMVYLAKQTGTKSFTKKENIPERTCPHCGADMNHSSAKKFCDRWEVYYECPNECKLTFEERFFFTKNELTISYEEDNNDV